VDARARRARGKPKIGRATETFERSLARVGEHIGDLIDSYPLMERVGSSELIGLLHAYAKALRPWARQVSRNMIEDVNARDAETWRTLAKAMSTQLRQDLATTRVGAVMATLMTEQTDLIASLPIEAAQRLQRLTVGGLITGARYAEIQADLERSGEVSKSHAKLIARTEVARTASNLTQARAEVAGAPLYRWRTVDDGAVRPGHRAMEGKICEWAHPPEVNEGGRIMYHHPGCVWNCRCWAEILIEDL
jgi:SPP1 gp7 family putative phage head morphogenesis protein